MDGAALLAASDDVAFACCRAAFRKKRLSSSPKVASWWSTDWVPSLKWTVNRNTKGASLLLEPAILLAHRIAIVPAIDPHAVT
jgi:hypothetical protein